MDHDYSLRARSSASEDGRVKPKKREPTEQRRLRDRKRAKTRVNIGDTFSRWRKLQQELGVRRDADVARVLLDSYYEGATSTFSRTYVTALSSDSQSDGRMNWTDHDEETWETASEDTDSDQDLVPSI